MARPNRVFYIGNELNFMTDNNRNPDEVKELYINALVSGFGPFPIVSVTVVDNVAIVDLGEECKLYPGVKISIDGTGDSEVDTWHEVQSIDGNTFSFNVETVDGTYTNGITLSYPSLGWTLLDRDSTRLLFKSGSSGTMTHRVLIEFRKTTDSPYTWYIVYKKLTDEANTVAEVKNFIPNDRDLVGYLFYSDSGYEADNKLKWFFYGDDAFVNLGVASIYAGWVNYQTVRQGGSLWIATFGELKKSDYNVSSFILNACRRDLNKNNESSGLWAYGFTGILYSPINSANSAIVYNSITEKSNYYSSFISDSYLNFLFMPSVTSGRDSFKDVSNTKFVKSTRYSSINILNGTFDEIGFVPGIYYLTKKPTGESVFTDAALKKVKCLGRLQDRHVYLRIGGTSANDINSIEDSTVNTSSNLYDFTGPIR